MPTLEIVSLHHTHSWHQQICVYLQPFHSKLVNSKRNCAFEGVSKFNENFLKKEPKFKQLKSPSPTISAQFTFEMQKLPKNHENPCFEGLRSFKVIDVGTAGKLDRQQCLLW